MALSLHFTDFPPIITHRGLSAVAPENTMAAFNAAHQNGFRWIETDVRLSADRIPMIFHDATLDRTTDHHGDFCNYPYSVLSKMNAGSWFSSNFANEYIPSLNQLLDFALQKSMGINIEIKPNLDEDSLTVDCISQLIAERASNPDILFSSFSVESLQHCQALLPRIPRALVVNEIDSHSPLEIVQLTESLGCTSLHIHHSLIYSELIQQCYYSPFDLMCYTVNDLDTAKKCWQAGCASIFSDNGLL
ncbi:glycerophosphodiester phosphodiesterase family protein [Pleionea mediterranea]|uniref:Glycerophosphoryl diester phosphodiesterase n=1 Tax=Pleionea mediterranea TaxID=523701 RepID=A0A316G0X3_9GAMM|nr:glycerophosphodiester phosphodiesterase family protein [Pleionea mediterranea]PWK53616.1 glycerophosphoryl diester phosphodiesterase [Pleionea mediterranea]